MLWSILCWLFAWLVPATAFAGALAGLLMLAAVLLGWIPFNPPWRR